MNITRNTPVLLGAALLALGGVGTGTASASLRTPQCSASNLTAEAYASHAPNSVDQAFTIRFDARPGTTCTMKGAFGSLTFGDAAGDPLPVGAVLPDPTGGERVVVAPGSPKYVYLASRKGTASHLAATVTFTLPSTAADRTVTTAWPTPLTGGPVRVGYVGDGVS